MGERRGEVGRQLGTVAARPLTADAPDWFSARTRALPAIVAEIAAPYLRAVPVGGQRRSAFDPPYWLLLPRWLLAAAPERCDRLATAFLPDILWGQYGLYLCIRIHDDLLDAQAADRRLVFAGDYILVEASRAFAPHVPSAFWPMFYEALTTSVASILEVQRHGTQGGEWCASDLDVHARIAHVFRLGSAAVCLATGQERALPATFALGDALAVMAQMLDDLSDLDEDLARGYLSPGAGFLLQSARESVRSAPISKALAQAVVIEDGIARFMEEMRKRLEVARQAAAELGLSDAQEYVTATGEHLARVEDELNAARVKAFFAPYFQKDANRNPRMTTEPTTIDDREK